MGFFAARLSRAVTIVAVAVVLGGGATTLLFSGHEHAPNPPSSDFVHYMCDEYRNGNPYYLDKKCAGEIRTSVVVLKPAASGPVWSNRVGAR